VKIISNFMHRSKEPESTSLSEQFSSIEWTEATRDAALQLWRSTLLTMGESMPLAPKQISEPHRRSLRQLVDELPSKPAPNVLEQRKQQTSDVLKSYGNQMGTFIDSQEREAKSVLGSVAQLTETLAGFDQRHAVRLQGITKKLRLLATTNDLSDIRAKLSAEVNALEKCLEEQQRDTKSALSRLTEDLNASEIRRQRALPGPGAKHVSDSLLALDRAVQGWQRYCLVRYDFRDRLGAAPADHAWKAQAEFIEQALPERMGHPVRTISPKGGVMLAAVNCQLLEYATQAEGIEKALSAATGFQCSSRVVEPLRGEAMREAMARLEKAL
jgi:hypothetical protein